MVPITVGFIRFTWRAKGHISTAAGVERLEVTIACF